MASPDDTEYAAQASSRHFDGLRFYLQKGDELHGRDVQTILEDELNKHTDFKKSWSAAERYYLSGRKQYKSGLTEEHCWALTCYTLREPKIHKKFKAACRSARRSEEKWDSFRFKGLWCLIVGAFKLLPDYQGETRKFYRGILEAPDFEEDQRIHFQHFVSASYSRSEATKFTGPSGCVLTLDRVPPEYVRDIKDFAEFKYHDEVLIWPLCTFVCKDARKRIFEFIEGEPPLRKYKTLACASATACPVSTTK